MQLKMNKKIHLTNICKYSLSVNNYLYVILTRSKPIHDNFCPQLEQCFIYSLSIAPPHCGHTEKIKSAPDK